MGSASSGSFTDASIGARQIGNRMPASIALASGVGMRVIARVSAGHSPVMAMSTPQTMNAPTAAEKLWVVAWAAISSAAPGVDQANDSGIRNRRLSTIAMIACAMHSVRSPDAASAGVAPTARRPASTSTKALANPVTAPTRPATIGWTMEPA